MNNEEIISQADVMVPNEYGNVEKVSWLNTINQEFFNVVKIPLFYSASTTTSGTYTLPNGVRARNIDLVQVGLSKYRSILEDPVQPGQNYWDFNDSSNTLTLHPTPYKSGLLLRVRYHQIATTTFTTNNLNVEPDAPPEFHWAYVLGLCSKIAKSMDDINKANNFENDYREFLNVAAANYAKDGTV